MGCFDFTYADNGENIRGRRGYIYLSPQVATKAGLSNPLPFDTTDMYGRFHMRIGALGINIDIFALYAVLIHADENKLYDDDNRFITLIRNRQFDDEYQKLNDILRSAGIDYFYRSIEYKDIAFHIIVPKISNQREKSLETNEVCWAETPLLISRKKLPVDVRTSLKTMARTWGYVSTSDPNQGWSTTHNQYCRYLCT